MVPFNGIDWKEIVRRLLSDDRALGIEPFTREELIDKKAKRLKLPKHGGIEPEQLSPPKLRMETPVRSQRADGNTPTNLFWKSTSDLRLSFNKLTVEGIEPPN
jgi:hypothetical protein